MATRKTPSEKLAELEKQLEQLNHRKQIILAQQKAEEEKKLKAEFRERYGSPERRARTHRLIQNGALAEKYLNCENYEPAEFENLLKRLVMLDAVKNIIPRGEE